MPYNTNLPPTIRRTSQNSGSPDNWELQDSTGTTIQTYTVDGMDVHVWWGDIISYIQSNSSSVLNAINDLSLLMVSRDWVVIS